MRQHEDNQQTILFFMKHTLEVRAKVHHPSMFSEAMFNIL
jgi:hypothetical protein